MILLKKSVKQEEISLEIQIVACILKFKSTGKGKPVACGPGAVSHSSAFLRNRNNVKQCIQTLVCFTKNKMKKGEKKTHHTFAWYYLYQNIRETYYFHLEGFHSTLLPCQLALRILSSRRFLKESSDLAAFTSAGSRFHF